MYTAEELTSLAMAQSIMVVTTTVRTIIHHAKQFPDTVDGKQAKSMLARLARQLLDDNDIKGHYPI